MELPTSGLPLKALENEDHWEHWLKTTESLVAGEKSNSGKEDLSDLNLYVQDYLSSDLQFKPGVECQGQH